MKERGSQASSVVSQPVDHRVLLEGRVVSRMADAEGKIIHCSSWTQEGAEWISSK